VNRHANFISSGLIEYLLQLPNADLRAAVLHKVFQNTHVRLLLLAFYPFPGDARVERQILDNLRVELQKTKIPHNSDKLTRKCSILEAVVFEIVTDFSQFHRILGTKKNNFEGAVERLRSAFDNSAGRFILPV